MPRPVILFVALLAGAACQRATTPTADARLRHDGPVVLLTIDTLRADRLGAYGSSRALTPVLDRLAQPPRGIVVTDAVAQAPLTLPSHATLLTGLHPPRHGVRTNDGFTLGPEPTTLAEIFKRAGYATGAFVGAAPVAASTGLARGFDIYDDAFLRADVNERRADDVLQAALAWMRTTPRFFAWVHLFDPHSPYEPPSPFADAHRDTPYDGEVAYTDAAIGRFLDGLAQAGLADRVLLVVAADHGEALGDHGERTHGTFLYDPTIHVPLIVRLPAGLETPVVPRLRGPVELADVAPTIAGLAGLSLGAAIDGRDLGRWLLASAPADGLAAERKAAYAETLYQHVLLGWSPLRALRAPDWKLIDAPSPELYHLERDPTESTNVHAAQPQVARAMAALLPPPVAPGSTAPTVTRETAERLQSLGYVAGRTSTSGADGPDPKDRIEEWNAIEDGIDRLARDPVAAAAAFRRAEALDPKNGLTQKYLGDLAFRAARWSEASTRYRRAMASGFQHPDVFVNLATIDERAGRIDAARALLAAAVEAHPADADAWNRLGLLDARRGDDGAARRAFERARELAPRDAEAFYNLALLDRRAGQDGSARTHLDEALSRDPGHVEARFELATLDLAAGNPGRALELYRVALQHRPDYPEALFGAARAALDLGRRDDARRYYEQFVRVAPPAFAAQVAAARQLLKTLDR